jgi:hypothetical protein
MLKPVLGLYIHLVHFVHNGKLDWWSNGAGNYRQQATPSRQPCRWKGSLTYELLLELLLLELLLLELLLLELLPAELELEPLLGLPLKSNGM